MKRLWCLLFLALLLLSLPGCARNPVTGEQQISFMSVEQQIEIGRKQYPIMTQIYNGELQDQQLQQYVSDIGQQLAAVSHDPDLPWKFNVVNESIANAYALPGGFVSITRGLLLQMEDENELAAVLGHEIAHATARHAAQQHARSVFANVLLTAGQIYLQTEGVAHAGLYSDLGSLGARAILASYSRGMEQQADRLGILYMSKAGYNPEGMVDLQQILLDQRKRNPNFVEQIFASHPLSERRIKDSRQQIKEVRGNIKIPKDQQINRFQPIVDRPWSPRLPAYDEMDTGVKMMEEEKYKEAVTHFDRAIQEYDQEALFHAWRGIALTQLEDRKQEGRQSLDRALELYSHVFRIRYYSGINHFELERYRDSLDDFEQAEELLSDVPDVKFYRGRNHEELGDREQAAEFYRAYLQQVNQGEKARYCYRKLREWGYL